MTIPIWAKNGNVTKPDNILFEEGFQSSTIGDNYWFNYLFQQATLHVQLPTGALIFSLDDAIESAEYDAYLLCDGSTIGSASSAATHAIDDLEELYAILWATNSPISGGTRGETANSDWMANKTLELPDVRGKLCASEKETESVFTNNYDTIGEETHSLTLAEMTSHNHIDGFTVTTPTLFSIFAQPGLYSEGLYTINLQLPFNFYANTANVGSNEAHSNIQESFIGNYFIKY